MNASPPSPSVPYRPFGACVSVILAAMGWTLWIVSIPFSVVALVLVNIAGSLGKLARLALGLRPNWIVIAVIAFCVAFWWFIAQLVGAIL